MPFVGHSLDVCSLLHRPFLDNKFVCFLISWAWVGQEASLNGVHLDKNLWGRFTLAGSKNSSGLGLKVFGFSPNRVFFFGGWRRVILIWYYLFF